MTLKIVRVENPGDIEQERLAMQAVMEIDIGRYIVLQARKSPDGKVFSGLMASAYWLESVTVRPGDRVVIYSKLGQRSQKMLDTGATSHFFYWGAPSPLWGDTYKPALIQAARWDWQPE